LNLCAAPADPGPGGCVPHHGPDPGILASPPRTRRAAGVCLGIAALLLGLVAAGAGMVWRYAASLPPLDLAAAAALV